MKFTRLFFSTLFISLPLTLHAAHPNIIYILLDDAGIGDLSCYGQKQFATPHIDKLATGGMRFTEHYAGSTVCAPTRCVLMSGVHTGHSYVRGNREVNPIGQAPIPGTLVTIPKLLRSAGYTTGAFGKWGLGAPATEGAPENQGFDRFFGYNCQRNAHTYYPTWLFDDAKKITLDGKTYAHDLIMEKALDWVRTAASDKEKPFFCFLPVTIPHAAMHVTEDYAAPFRKKFPQFEDTIGNYAGPPVKNPVAAFAGMMTKLDDDIGNLMALLQELGIDENTIVMLSSDNGPHREGGHKPDFFDSNGPYRGYKRDLYEGGIRAPLIARWPGKITPGTTSHLISAQWDMLPTFCEIAGIDSPADIDGISILPELTGKTEEQKQHDFLYWEFFEGGGKRAVRMEKWKAVQLNLNQDLNGPIQLFDLDADAGEKKDIADKHPDILNKMKAAFQKSHAPSEHWQWGDNKKKKKDAA